MTTRDRRGQFLPCVANERGSAPSALESSRRPGELRPIRQARSAAGFRSKVVEPGEIGLPRSPCESRIPFAGPSTEPKANWRRSRRRSATRLPPRRRATEERDERGLKPDHGVEPDQPTSL